MSCKGGDIRSLLSKVTPLVNMLAFQPPKDILYTIDKHNMKLIERNDDLKKKVKNDPSGEVYSISLTHDQYPVLHSSSYHWITIESYLIFSPTKQSSIVVIHLRNKTVMNEKKHYTILFSHGNAATIGSIYTFLFDLSTQLKCDVVAYDYNGYGHSKGKASEEAIKSNVNDVYILMRNVLGIKKDNIIVYGISIGTVPSCYISSKRHIAGLILHAPLASGNLLFNESYELKEDIADDPFCNWKMVSHIDCPIFLIHGQVDNVIPYDHSVFLSDKITHLVKWFPKKGNHNNIYNIYRSKFIMKTMKFLGIITNLQLNKKSKKQH